MFCVTRPVRNIISAADFDPEDLQKDNGDGDTADDLAARAHYLDVG
jgi:hypothetical protein